MGMKVNLDLLNKTIHLDPHLPLREDINKYELDPVAFEQILDSKIKNLVHAYIESMKFGIIS